jgi:large repetitive protein
VNPRVTPLFNPIPDLCSGDPAPTLPAISQNGISGTWSPATVNTSASGTYTFTPESSECADQQDITITVKPPTIISVIYHD